MCTGALLKAGLYGYKIHEQVRAGEAAEESYQDLAAEERREANFEAVVGVEKTHEALVASQMEAGSIKARAGKTGIGVGSMLTQAKGRYRAFVRSLNLQTSESMRRHELAAKRFIKSGKQARKAAWLEALGTGIAGTYDIGSKYPKENPVFG